MNIINYEQHEVMEKAIVSHKGGGWAQVMNIGIPTTRVRPTCICDGEGM